MQNNNEITLTLAPHSAINVFHFYHTSSNYNMRKLTNVNKNIPKYNWAVRNGRSMELNNYIKIANFKTQSDMIATIY